MDQLDNITWHSLRGAHARFSVGTDHTRRYGPGFSPIAGFSDPRAPRFDELRSLCTPGEPFYCEGWGGAAPAGWQVVAEKTMLKMVWEGAEPADDDAPEARLLGADDAPQALELALLTKPGPFGLRTIELGEYFGVFDGERLVAMAGERMQAGRLREISGVCTHPSAQGRGLARRLMHKLLRRQMQRGELPFLHVMADNTVAVGLYERMGFVTRRDTVVRVVSMA